MKIFKLTNKAKNDLVQFAVFTEQRWDKSQRNFYIKQFDDVFHLLANNPFTEKACIISKKATDNSPREVILFFIIKQI
jgi:toxin ParE1/3/4